MKLRAIGKGPWGPMEVHSTPVNAALGVIWLVLVALLLPSLSVDENLLPERVQSILGLVLLVIWIAVAFELFVALAARRECWSWSAAMYAVLAALIPPLRVGLSPVSRPGAVWLPALGWRERGRALERELERIFSGPMILVALMILPLLAIEYFWRDRLHENAVLEFIVNAGTRFIWFAFAAEFAVRVSATQNRLRYCGRHWLDVVIIVLPFVSFLRALRLAQLTTVQQSLRAYRLRGTGTRLMRALALLKVFERYSQRAAQYRIKQLRARVTDMEEEIRDLKEEIEILERHAAEHAERRVRRKPERQVEECE